MKTLEELKQSYNEKLAALKKEKNEALKQAKARSEKKTAAEKTRLRKQDTRLKIIIGGYLIAQLRETKDKKFLDKVATSVKSERDKELIKSLAQTL